MASPGSQSAGREQAKQDKAKSDRTAGGQLGGAGTSALSSGATGAQAGRLDRDQQTAVNGRLAGTADNPGTAGKSTASSGDSDATAAGLLSAMTKPSGPTGPAGTNALTGGDNAPTFSRRGAPGDLSSSPDSADKYDITGRLLSEGTSPYVSDPSIGQLVGAGLTAAPMAGSLNNAVGAGESALDGGKFGDSYDGGAIGRLIDGMRGVQPGPVTGFTGSRVSSSTNSRGGELSSVDDPRLADRASAAATNALTGDAPTVGAGTDALFSDVALTDRRKPRSDLAGTNVLLKAA